VCLKREEYEALLAEKNALGEKMLRIAAEYDNYRKRVHKEKEIWERSVYKEMLQDLLSVLSSVNRGIEAGDGSVSGLEALRDQILSILERRRVYPIEAEGKPFDPDLHEAVLTEETDAVPDRTVLEVLEQGYTFDGAVLVPSKVKVSKYPPGGKKEKEKAPSAPAADGDAEGEDAPPAPGNAEGGDGAGKDER